MILSLETDGKTMKDIKAYRAIVRTPRSDDRVLITIPSKGSGKQRTAALRAAHEVLETATLVPISSSQHAALSKELVALEDRLLNNKFKFGVLFYKAGQTEEDMYKNGTLLYVGHV